MHYLEDDLDMLEGIPEELKQQCFKMRELDARVEKASSEVKEASRELFNVLQTLTQAERERRYEKIRGSYQDIREMSREKVAIADYLHFMLEKYQERLSKDLTEFKYELEADTPGVTESIEKELVETIKNTNANRRGLTSSSNMSTRILLDDDLLSAADDLYEDVKPSTSSLNQNSTNSPRMNGHRGSSDRQMIGEDFKLTDMEGENETEDEEDEEGDDESFMPTSSRSQGGAGRLDQHYFSASKKKNQQNRSGLVSNRRTSEKKMPQIQMGVSASSRGSSSPKSHGIATSSTDYPSTGSTVRHHSMSSLSGPSASTSMSFNQMAVTNTAALAMPAFAGGQESHYGRPVKLTSRVQQMLKEKTHRVGRPTVQNAVSSSAEAGPGPLVNYFQSPGRLGQVSGVSSMELSEEEAGGHLYANNQTAMEVEEEEEEDQDSRVWCICQQKSEGDMVACDSKTCPYEWFHYNCVGITATPKGKWFCPECMRHQQEQLRRSHSMESQPR